MKFDPTEKKPTLVIISSNPIRMDQGNGILMGSLFGSWPIQKLTQIYYPMLVGHRPQKDFCEEHRAISLIGNVSIFHQEDCISLDQTAPLKRHFHVLKSFVRLLQRSDWLISFFRALSELWYVSFRHEQVLMKQLEAIKPDVVYALLGTYWLTYIVHRVTKRLDIPLVIHLTDDFIEGLYKNRPGGFFLTRAAEQAVRNVTNNSSARVAISPVMASEFQKRYGQKWDWITTPISGQIPVGLEREAGRPLCVFAGNLGIGRWESLRECAELLKRCGSQSGKFPRLVIYASQEQIQQYGSKLKVPGITEIAGWIPMKELQKIFLNADILIHVESLIEQYSRYTRYSFSTKISQYMMSGRSILAYGPEKCGSLRVIADAKAGLCISSMDKQAEQQVTHLLSDQKQRQQYGHQGREWAMKWCEVQKTQHRLYSILAKAAAVKDDIL